MTTYLKVEGDLVDAPRRIRMNLGMNNVSFAIVPEGLTSSGWVDEITGNAVPLGTTSTIVENGVSVNGGGSAGGIKVPAGLVSDNFTLLLVLTGVGGTRYMGEVGQYKFACASANGGLHWVERTGVSRSIMAGGQLAQQVVVARCAGTNSRVISGGSTPQDQSINDVSRSPFASQWVGSATGTVLWHAMAVTPDALTDGEMDAVLAQNLINFPEAAR